MGALAVCYTTWSFSGLQEHETKSSGPYRKVYGLATRVGFGVGFRVYIRFRVQGLVAI